MLWPRYANPSAPIIVGAVRHLRFSALQARPQECFSRLPDQAAPTLSESYR
jgi:hypothetical protein